MHHQILRGQNNRYVDVNDINKMNIFHSMPKIVEPEITEPTVWTLKYALPLAVVEKYAPLKKPAGGVKWRANFYKCADNTSRPHWLTWSVVENPKPDFHLSQYFGILQFE